MSKKMMKRSLALGALMAFVITGQAWAAEYSPDNVPSNGPIFTNSGESNNLIGNGTETVILKQDEDYNKNPGVSYPFPLQASGSTVVTTVKNINALIIDGEYDVSDLGNPWGPIGVGTGGTLNLGTEDAKIGIIKTSDGAVAGMAFNIGDGGKLNVYADKIDIRNTFSNNVYLQYGGEININAKDIYLSGGRALATDSDNGSLSTYLDSTITVIGTDSVKLICTKNRENHKDNAIRCLTANGKNNVTVNVDGKDVYIEAADVALFVEKQGAINVGQKQITEKVVVNGGLLARNGGIINLNLGSAGSLTGQIINDGNSTVNINLGSNSTMDISSGTGEQNVTALSGTGTVIVGSDDSLTIGTNNANLTVSGDAALTESLEAGGNVNEALEGLAEKVTVTEGNAVAKVTIAEGDVLGAVTASVNENGNVVAGSAKTAVNSKAAKVSKAATNLKAHYRVHMNDMNKRMGELRMANGEAGVWTRMVRGESEYEGAKMQYNQYQLGYDEKLSVDKRWTVGAAVTFAEGDGSYGQGSTEDKSTAFAIYGSKLNNDGTFVDLIARYAHLESDMEDSKYGNGDYSTNGMSVSAEFGKRIQQGNGLWVEPQVELTYGTVDSANFKLDEGYNAHFDSMDSFIARVGLSIGKDIKQGNVYARASYLYDFDGETTSLVTNAAGVGTPTPEDFGGGWWEVGVGANINLSKATYIYADVEKTFGGEVDTNWQWNLGVRYSF